MGKTFCKQYCNYIFIITIIILTGCNKRLSLNLESGKYLLYNQTIKGNKQVSNEQLQLYIRQKPNKKIFGIRASLYMYYIAKRFYHPERIQSKIIRVNNRFDTKIASLGNDTLAIKKLEKKKAKKLARLNRKLEEGNWIMRHLGSAPVVFDSAIANNTVNQMQLYLKSKGYFLSGTRYDPDTVLSAIFLKYEITEGIRYKIRQIKYQAEDGSLKRLINEYAEEELLKEEEAYDEQVLTKERDRLEKLFRDNGYFYFTKKYITFSLDTSNYKVDIVVNIANPENNELHKTYKINKVVIDIDQENENAQDKDSITTKKYRNITFSYANRFYLPKVLWNKMEITTGNKYSQAQTQFTQRNLGQLDAFRTISITYTKDSANSLLAKIKLNSLNKFQISDEIGVSVSQGLPGPYGSLTFLTRNLFNGCETFDLNLRAGIEGVASASDKSKIYKSIEIGAGAGLTFPQLFTILNINPYFINNNPKTRLNLNYNFIFRPEYTRSNLRFGLSYFLSKNTYKQYSLSLIDINYIRTPFLSDSFQVYLNRLKNQGNNLYRSFQNTINTDINFGYTFNNYEIGVNKKASYFKFYAESGGTIINLFSHSSQQTFKEALGLNTTFIYWKINLDARAYLPVTRKSSFATRFNFGIANPYAGDGVLPYEKYFFSGGTNSIRAWLPRRVGPGSYAVLNSDGSTNYNFEQPGLIQLEFNEEYRFKIIKFLDGALFVDAGNVWLLDDPDERKNFKSEFLTELAVAGGFGLRCDFSFLIVRLDAGLKLWDPSKKLADRWVAKHIDFLSPEDLFKKATWNIAVGYPF